ncbi:MAG: hypothetical protein K9L86_04190 [Candidatus Omnitrophica bacterium]|nr:hypothetical protein [Candidatus Omnitrophota bacterium]
MPPTLNKISGWFEDHSINLSAALLFRIKKALKTPMIPIRAINLGMSPKALKETEIKLEAKKRVIKNKTLLIFLKLFLRSLF